MDYTLLDFVENLKAEGGNNIGHINMQSDEATDIINDCLPRNQLLRRMFETDSPKLLMSDRELRQP